MDKVKKKHVTLLVFNGFCCIFATKPKLTMTPIAIYTLTSQLHNEESVAQATKQFLGSLGIAFDLKGADFADYGQAALNLIYVRTGGTEGIFRTLLPKLEPLHLPFYLLTSGTSNSLAASMEILSYLRQHGLPGEIIHGSADYIRSRISILQHVGEARRKLCGQRLGIIGKPSDWLISSDANPDEVRKRLGIELVDIPMSEMLDGGKDIYSSLKTIIDRHQLQGFTLRCFDLLTALHDTGCMALAQLNSEGYVAGCEGDVPAMLSMAIVRSLFGVSGFQANPANLNPETGEITLAHCTIPLDMVERYELDTHFESGIGTAIRGFMKTGDVTLFKVSADLRRHFIAQGTLLRNESKPNLCRTQQVIRLQQPEQIRYFLTDPIGNHHIVVPGHGGELLNEIMK